ncbi:MAG: peptidylprolyl isomerase [Betaproteobacteria bacterium]
MVLAAVAQSVQAQSSDAAAGAEPQASTPVDFIVAIVNSEPITNQDVRNRMQRLAARSERALAAAELGRLALDSLIAERVQVQAAADLGIRVDDASVEQALADVARQNQVSASELRQRLAADGINFERYRRELRDEIAVMRLRDRELESRVRVNEQDIDRHLIERQAAAASAEPTQIHLAQILVEVPEASTPEQERALQAKAEQLRRQLDAGADFAALALQASDAPDKANGGQLGARSPDRYPPLFVDATRTLAVGAVTGPVRSGAGFHLLKLLERQMPGDDLNSVVQTRARHILLKPGPRLTEAAARARLAEFGKRVRSQQADFAQLAREFSEDGSARAGGDLGWVSPGMLVPEFEQVMDALAPGEVSQPLVSRFGVHLIEVLERREVPLSDKERRDLARRELRERKTEEALRTWLQDLRGRAYVEYREPPAS